MQYKTAECHQNLTLHFENAPTPCMKNRRFSQTYSLGSLRTVEDGSDCRHSSSIIQISQVNSALLIRLRTQKHFSSIGWLVILQAELRPNQIPGLIDKFGTAI